MDGIILLIVLGAFFLIAATFSVALIVFLGGLALGDRDDFYEDV
jgi:hypothetical protein